MKIWTVDAFTSKPFAGNPAAVTIVADFPDDHICQQIAQEINLSETAFIKPLANNHFHIRWFTPLVEVKLCGHATLASAHILFSQHFATETAIKFESLSGELKVHQGTGWITLDFPLQPVSEQLSVTEFSTLLKIDILNAVRALDDVIIELPSAQAVRDFQPDFSLIKQVNCRGLIITARDNQRYDFISRFFAPNVGVLEDPVTGSAHCKLVDYWSKQLNQSRFFAYQASTRGGELRLELQQQRVLIQGQAVTMFIGEMVGTSLLSAA